MITPTCMLYVYMYILLTIKFTINVWKRFRKLQRIKHYNLYNVRAILKILKKLYKIQLLFKI